MDDWARAVFRAREVLGEDPRDMPADAGPVRPLVYESWRRSKLQGLSPDHVAPGYHPEVELDSYLTRVVEPVVARHCAPLEQAGCSMALTDHEGRLLRRWVPDRAMASQLDALDVAPRFSVSESCVGTTSAIALLSGSPVLVRGPEHFSERFNGLSCAGAPIVHPVNRRTVGTLDVTCRYQDTSPIVLAWVTDLVREVREALRQSGSRREQVLLSSYLAHNRDARHPLVTLDENTIITNAAAARLLGSMDQAMLWEHACRAMGERRTSAHPLILPDGTRVMVEAVPVADGATTVGAVLKLRRLREPEPTAPCAAAVPRLPGLVGTGPRWTALCGEASRIGSGERVLLVGERGSGRGAVARALAGKVPVRLLDARDVEALGTREWFRAVETEVDGPDEALVLRHVDLLDAALAESCDAAVARRPSGRRIFATSESGPLTPGSNPLLDTFTSVLTVPPLRDRTEDLPVLLAALTARVVGSATVRWMPDAVQALSRLEWPGNVAALESLVRRLVSRCADGGYLGAGDLPPDVVAGAARRRLANLEQAEAKAILSALRDAGGNKHRAAESLGIARSTLYRKVRALGLDLSTATF
ncbi:MAG TPA: helix-turn-helix domain-containing protein [Pseudonocardia sp.]